MVLKKDKSIEVLPYTKTPWYHTTPSKGELKISKYLKDHNINFNTEKTFKDLKNPKTNQKLRLDFYIPKLNLAIEFDGIQHTVQTKEFHGVGRKGLKNFINQVYKDCIKNLFCKKNNIRLIRISYLQYFEIEQILEQELNENKEV